MNMSTTSKQLSTTNSASPTKGTTEENTTTVTPRSSHVASTNATSASPRANNFGRTFQEKTSGVIVKNDSGERSKDVLLSPGTVAVIAFAITSVAVVFIFLMLGIRRKRGKHRGERSLANSSQQATFRSIPRYIAGDINLLDSKPDESITFHPICHPDDGTDKCDTVPLQGDDTALASATAAETEVYGSQRELKQMENYPTPMSSEVTDAEEQSRRRHQDADTNDVNTASHFNGI